MIALIDYGMGNLRSVQKALETTGAEVCITQKAESIQEAEKIVLPGVGATKPAMDKLFSLGLVESIKESIAANKPFLGICLGFQLLFEQSYEGGCVEGLGIIKGSVKKFESLKVPHMGWNQLEAVRKDCPLFQGIDDGTNVYFCHSYYAEPKENKVIATLTDYGINFASSIYDKNVFGVQFHPEKSQEVGLKILQNFAKT